MQQPHSTRPHPGRALRKGDRLRWIGVIAATTCAALLPATRSFGQGGPPSDPKGNNGTVKVDGAPFDDHPNNEPHPGCNFQIDFYGYDARVGDAQVSFALQAPTTDGSLSVQGGDLSPDIGQDAAGGGTDLDASETYHLAFTGQPARQGYHVKLTVHAPGSIGADTKHKVFWVTSCNAPAPAPELATTTTTAPTITTAGGKVEGTGLDREPTAVEGRELDAAAAAAAAAAAPATPQAAGATAVAGSPSLTG